MITVLSGGVGAARLLRALRNEIDPKELCAVVNVGDDLVLHGLTICPDLDTISYTLAGLNNDELGWGLRDESWRVMKELHELGGESWFGLGDRDFATHLYRSQRLDEGATKTQVTSELCQHWGVDIDLLPVTNDNIATVFDDRTRNLEFPGILCQISPRHRGPSNHHPRASGIKTDARGRSTHSHSSRIIIAPSNPLISIDPILQVPPVREMVRERRERRHRDLTDHRRRRAQGTGGPIMREFGYDVTCEGVATSMTA